VSAVLVAGLVLAAVACGPPAVAPPAAPAAAADSADVQPVQPAPAPAPAVTLQLHYVDAQPGELTTFNTELTMREQFIRNGRAFDATVIQRKRYHTEVLEVSGGFTTRAAVHYEFQEEIQTIADRPTVTQPGPVHGKRYVVWKDENGFHATADDGSAPSADEMSELDDFQNMGKMSGELEVMLARTWKTGERHELSAAELKALEAGTKNIVTSGAITLLAVDGNTATFRMEVSAARDNPAIGSILMFSLSTERRLDIPHLRPIDGKIEGTITGAVRNMPVTGTMEGFEIYSYP
jgi:hypothetical protein